MESAMTNKCVCGLTDPRLEDLNLQTFAAEEKRSIDGEEWDSFLARVLSEDFYIRRANPAIPMQNRKDIIAHIQASQPVKRHIANVETFQDGDYGVVCCLVTLEGRTERYHNLKVFARSPENEWQCAYWRVTKLPGA